jgi:mono/diheme cytochrome c family protein
VEDKLKRPFLDHAPWARLHPDVGTAMFKTQCSSCHTLHGYRALSGFLKDRDEESIYLFLTMLQQGEENPYRFIMPPVLGTEDDLKALAAYLAREIEPGESETAVAP